MNDQSESKGEAIRSSFSISTFLAWSIFALTLILAIAGLWIFFITRGIDAGPRWGPRYFSVGFGPSFGAMGLLIVTRQPKNRVAWLYVFFGLDASIHLFLENYAVLAVLASQGIFPLGELAAWVASWVWVPYTVLAITLLPLIFPDGKLMSPRWRLLVWMDILVVLSFLLVFALGAGPMTNFTYRDNPFGFFNFERTGRYAYNTLIYFFIQLLALPLILASVASVFIRLKKSTGIERQQLKWFAYAGAGLFVGAVGGFIGPVIGGIYYVIGPFMLIVAFMAIPIVTGMAILRYRLWDIDLLIRRTLQYTLLTGLLVGIYIVTIILLQNLVAWMSGQNSPLVIVISTLLIAALFSPIRIRVQDFIDRRFYRSKYNAETILAEFASIARSETDIDRLSTTILQIADATIRPAQLSLWLKKPHDHRGK